MNKELQIYLAQKVILYAEDDEVARQAVQDYLEILFKRVILAKDGVEAFRLYQEKKPDMILSDIDMPGMSGIELIKKIRAKDQETPILIMTAHTSTEYLIEAVELNLARYIIKPFIGDEFLKALEKIFNLEQKIIQITPTLSYDFENKSLEEEGRVVELTKKESKLLELLLNKRNRLVSYEEIEVVVWSELNDMMTSDTLRAMVKLLRKKLPEGTIQNVTGLGYKIKTL